MSKRKNSSSKKKIKLTLKLAWTVTNIPAYIIMIIAFVYDSIEIIRGNVADITYEIIFSSICILFVCFTINDYYQFGIIVYLISITLKPIILPNAFTSSISISYTIAE